MKICTICGIAKSTAGYFRSGVHPSGKPKHRGECKECSMALTAAWRLKNKSHYNNYVAMWRAHNPHKQHASEIKRRYGLSFVEYEAILDKQHRQCAICLKDHDPETKRGRLYVDHCHKTGKIRGLLCGHCNSLIAYASDSVDVLHRAIAYLA